MRQRKLDPQVEKYLLRLRKEAAVLPADQRRELLEDIRAHAEAALAGGETPDQVVVQLGEPAQIVAELEPEPTRVGEFPGRDVAVMLLLVMTLFFTVLAWVAAAVVARRSTAWTRAQKLIGLVVWPWAMYAMNIAVTRWPAGPARLATGPVTWFFWMSVPFGTFAWTGAVYLYLRHPARIARQRAKQAEGSVLRRTLGDSFTLRRGERF